MLMCKDISKLVSQSLDCKLPLRVRMEVRLHLMMCSICRTYRKRLFFMRDVIRKSAGRSDDCADHRHLSEAAERRIKEALREAAEETSADL